MIKLKQLLEKDVQGEFSFMKKMPKITDCQRLFGKELFGDFYNEFYDTHKNEMDTDKERSFFEMLEDWIYHGRRFDLENELLTAFLQLYKCKNEYPDELKSKNITNKIYRTTTIYREDVKKIKIVNNVTEGDIHYWYVSKHDVNYKPKSKFQSWTVLFNTADSISDREVPENKIQVILGMSTKGENILFNDDFINMIDRSVSIEEEDEVIRLGNTPKKCKLFIRKDDYEEIKND